jgi:hypothetical protein
VGGTAAGEAALNGGKSLVCRELMEPLPPAGDTDQVVSLPSLLLLPEEVPNVAATLTLKPLDALIVGFLYDDIRLEAARATKRSGHVDSGTVIRASPGTQFKVRHPHRRDPPAVSDDDQVVDLLRAVRDELRALRADWGGTSGRRTI